MKFLVLASSFVMFTGCASVIEVTNKYDVCYYGDKKRALCESTPVPEGDERVCVDLSRYSDFSEGDCEKIVGRTGGSLFGW